MRYREEIQRIDANTDDVVDNVQGAQRELLKYWSRVSGNRWLVTKMFGVLMASYRMFWVKFRDADVCLDFLPALGAHCWIDLLKYRRASVLVAV